MLCLQKKGFSHGIPELAWQHTRVRHTHKSNVKKTKPKYIPLLAPYNAFTHTRVNFHRNYFPCKKC